MIMEILNRKAKFNYFIEDELECGIELLGNEVKSIREGSCNIKDSYERIKNNEVFVINMFIMEIMKIIVIVFITKDLIIMNVN